MVASRFSGIFVMILTTPPMALPPYRLENGPSTTSIRSISSTDIPPHVTLPVYESFMTMPSFRMSVRFASGMPRSVMLERVSIRPLPRRSYTPGTYFNASSTVLTLRFSISLLVTTCASPGTLSRLFSERVAVTTTSSSRASGAFGSAAAGISVLSSGEAGASAAYDHSAHTSIRTPTISAANPFPIVLLLGPHRRRLLQSEWNGASASFRVGAGTLAKGFACPRPQFMLFSSNRTGKRARESTATPSRRAGR